MILLSNESYLLHDPQKFVLIDPSICIGIGSCDHVINGRIIQIEVAFAEHVFELGRIEVSRIVAIVMPEHFKHLHLQIVSV